MISSNSPYRKKLTKVVATISDIKCEPEFIKSLYEAGMDVVRLNTAHQTPEGTLTTIENVRKISDRIPLMLDTKGPEVRTRPSAEPLVVNKGDVIEIQGASEDSSGNKINVNYDKFSEDVAVGSQILIDDGHMALKVIERRGNLLICTAENDGFIKGKKTINVPGGSLKQPSVSIKDIEYIEFAVKHDLDFIAHSFVRNKEDILAVRELLNKHNSKIQIIAKIENQEGMNNIDEILEYADGIMVARGDLGVELPASQVPLAQKLLIRKCIAAGKPVIVATHMLESMIKNPRPTRAEVSDVANAILDGAGAIMLSGETAYGDYPIESVKTMATIAIELEEKKSDMKHATLVMKTDDQTMIMSRAAIVAAISLDVKGIVVPTGGGRSARVLSSFRSKKPIFAKCYNKHVMRQLALSYGVHATYFENKHTNMDELVAEGLSQLVETGKLLPEEVVVILAKTPAFEKNLPNFLEVATVRECLERGRKR